MANIKIVFTGTVGAGKTEAIRTLSDIEVVKTDVKPTDDVKNMKDGTTIAMDYGEVTIGEHETLALFGTPGQKRFSYMWEILSEGALGIVIMVDNTRSDPLADICCYFENFEKYINQSTAVFGITHLDLAANPQQEMHKYYDFMDRNGYDYPVFPVDARKRADVVVLVESLMAMLEVG